MANVVLVFSDIFSGGFQEAIAGVGASAEVVQSMWLVSLRRLLELFGGLKIGFEIFTILICLRESSCELG